MPCPSSTFVTISLRNCWFSLCVFAFVSTLCWRIKSDVFALVRLCLARWDFSTLRFCFGKGNGGGRFARGREVPGCRGVSDDDAAAEILMQKWNHSESLLTEKFRHFMTGHFSHVRHHAAGHGRMNLVAHLLKNGRISGFGIILNGDDAVFVPCLKFDRCRARITLTERPALLFIAVVFESWLSWRNKLAFKRGAGGACVSAVLARSSGGDDWADSSSLFNVFVSNRGLKEQRFLLILCVENIVQLT